MRIPFARWLQAARWPKEIKKSCTIHQWYCKDTYSIQRPAFQGLLSNSAVSRNMQHAAEGRPRSLVRECVRSMQRGRGLRMSRPLLAAAPLHTCAAAAAAAGRLTELLHGTPTLQCLRSRLAGGPGPPSATAGQVLPDRFCQRQQDRGGADGRCTLCRIGRHATLQHDDTCRKPQMCAAGPVVGRQPLHQE